MDDPHLKRALLLLHQDRHELAEQELRKGLLDAPEDGASRAVLAFCLLERRAYAEAEAEAREAIRLAPDRPLPHYAMARVLRERRRYAEAETAIAEAIALDPFSADSFAQQSLIYLDQGKWAAARQAAEMGLSIDPEDVACANLRGMALVKLGQPDDAFQALESALERNPENAYTHANLGWNRLEKGRPREALDHFREALRLNPELEWARFGVVEALKARFFVYRWLLGYFLWMAKLNRRAQWAVVLGLYIGYRLLRSVAHSSPELEPYLRPLLWLYIAFAILTWLGQPLFNLLLRLHPVGKYALSRMQILASNCVVACLLASLVLAVIGFVRSDVGTLVLAGASGLLVVPVTGSFQVPNGWPRTTMIVYTAVLVGLVMLSLFGYFAVPSLGDIALAPAVIALLGIFVGQFLINGLMGQVVRR